MPTKKTRRPRMRGISRNRAAIVRRNSRSARHLGASGAANSANPDGLAEYATRRDDQRGQVVER